MNLSKLVNSYSSDSKETLQCFVIPFTLLISFCVYREPDADIFFTQVKLRQ